MKRTFVFKWHENVKYGSPIERTNSILVPKASEEIGHDAKMATELFTGAFGNLKKNTIISIQEVNEKGEPIGEPIIPADENSIVPYKK